MQPPFPKDSELGAFVRRAWVVVVCAAALLIFAKTLGPWTPWQIRAELDGAAKRADVEELRDSVDRLAHVVELSVVIQVEAAGSAEQLRALNELRSLRRVTSTKVQ